MHVVFPWIVIPLDPAGTDQERFDVHVQVPDGMWTRVVDAVAAFSAVCTSEKLQLAALIVPPAAIVYSPPPLADCVKPLATAIARMVSVALTVSEEEYVGLPVVGCEPSSV